jgi:hypothetical protein
MARERFKIGDTVLLKSDSLVKNSSLRRVYIGNKYKITNLQGPRSLLTGNYDFTYCLDLPNDQFGWIWAEDDLILTDQNIKCRKGK